MRILKIQSLFFALLIFNFSYNILGMIASDEECILWHAESLPLAKAVAKTDLEQVRAIISLDNVNQEVRYYKCTPLHIVCYSYTSWKPNNSIEITKELLKHGANINARDYNGETPLQTAAKEGCLEIIQLLLDAGSYIQSSDYAIQTSSFVIQPTHKASNFAHQSFEALAKHEASMDTSSDPAAAPDKPNQATRRMVNSKDKYGETPLHRAAQNVHINIVKLLIESGADVNAQDNIGDTPLHKVARDNRRFGDMWHPIGESGIETAKILLENNANKDIKNNSGYTPVEIIENARFKTNQKLKEFISNFRYRLLNKVVNFINKNREKFEPKEELSKRLPKELLELIND